MSIDVYDEAVPPWVPLAHLCGPGDSASLRFYGYFLVPCVDVRKGLKRTAVKIGGVYGTVKGVIRPSFALVLLRAVGIWVIHLPDS